MPYEWFKMHSRGWLTGSIRENMTGEERSVWADFLAMANESRIRGVICRAEGIPYSREYIANYLGVSVELVNSTIDKCKNDKNSQDDLHRIELDEVGCIIITNWRNYQAVPDGKRLIPETPAEREYRERRRLRRDVRKYPADAKAAMLEVQNTERLDSQAEQAQAKIKDTPVVT